MPAAPACDAFLRICLCDTAQREHRDGYAAHGCAQSVDTLRRSIDGFRHSGEDRAEDREIGAFLLGPLQLFDRVRGDTDQENRAGSECVENSERWNLRAGGRPWAPQASATSVREFTRIRVP